MHLGHSHASTSPWSEAVLGARLLHTWHRSDTVSLPVGTPKRVWDCPDCGWASRACCTTSWCSPPIAPLSSGAMVVGAGSGGWSRLWSSALVVGAGSGGACPVAGCGRNWSSACSAPGDRSGCRCCCCSGSCTGTAGCCCSCCSCSCNCWISCCCVCCCVDCSAGTGGCCCSACGCRGTSCSGCITGGCCGGLCSGTVRKCGSPIGRSSSLPRSGLQRIWSAGSSGGSCRACVERIQGNVDWPEDWPGIWLVILPSATRGRLESSWPSAWLGAGRRMASVDSGLGMSWRLMGSGVSQIAWASFPALQLSRASLLVH